MLFNGETNLSVTPEEWAFCFNQLEVPIPDWLTYLQFQAECGRQASESSRMRTQQINSTTDWAWKIHQHYSILPDSTYQHTNACPELICIPHYQHFGTTPPPSQPSCSFCKNCQSAQPISAVPEWIRLGLNESYLVVSSFVDFDETGG